jgi:plasmid stabilization system protein ParE
MGNSLHVIQSALDDIQNALDWYASQSEGLETRFHKALMERLKFIQKNPEAASFLDSRFRGSKLKKFPFTVYYNFDEANAMVRVGAILHNKRNKSVLKTRI